MKTKMSNCILHDGGYATRYNTTILLPNGDTFGWASFDDSKYYEYEHTVFVIVPVDIGYFYENEFSGNGVEMFERGEIVFDTLPSGYGGSVPVPVRSSQTSPSLGGRYISFDDRFLTDRLYLNDYDMEIFAFLLP